MPRVQPSDANWVAHATVSYRMSTPYRTLNDIERTARFSYSRSSPGGYTTNRRLRWSQLANESLSRLSKVVTRFERSAATDRFQR